MVSKCRYDKGHFYFDENLKRRKVILKSFLSFTCFLKTKKIREYVCNISSLFEKNQLSKCANEYTNEPAFKFVLCFLLCLVDLVVKCCEPTIVFLFSFFLLTKFIHWYLEHKLFHIWVDTRRSFLSFGEQNLFIYFVHRRHFTPVNLQNRYSRVVFI